MGATIAGFRLRRRFDTCSRNLWVLSRRANAIR
jgi:hypothetical protein